MPFFHRVYQSSDRIVRHHWLTIAFLLGFIVDNLTLTRVDQVFDNAILLIYILLAMLSIMGLYAGIAGRFGERTNEWLRAKCPLIMQYAFGGLLSGMLIFYGRSSSLQDSWLFILIIVGVIYGNETIKDRSGRLVYNLVIFFIGIFAYTVLIIPVLFGKMGPWIFVGSGFVALIVIYLFYRILEKIIPRFATLQKRTVVFVISLVYLTLNIMYFTNIIPPIPLSLKHVGIYHDVERNANGTYSLTYEKPKWWEWYRTSDTAFHSAHGEPVYCFASVFAPSRLATKIYHRWQFYSPAEGDWVDKGRFEYTIQGGRDGGYRGYTKIESYKEGKWRCIVETERGQVIGRETFTITSEPRGEFATLVQ